MSRRRSGSLARAWIQPILVDPNSPEVVVQGLARKRSDLAGPNPQTGFPGPAFTAEGVAGFRARQALGNPEAELDEATLAKHRPVTAEEIAADLREVWEQLRQRWRPSGTPPGRSLARRRPRRAVPESQRHRGRVDPRTDPGAWRLLAGPRGANCGRRAARAGRLSPGRLGIRKILRSLYRYTRGGYQDYSHPLSLHTGTVSIFVAVHGSKLLFRLFADFAMIPAQLATIMHRKAINMAGKVGCWQP